VTEPKLKKGDRVRVVYEGVVDWVSSTSTTFELGGSESGHYPHDPTRVSIEKLPDPEPQWVNGDVISVPERGSGWPPAEFHRIGDRWLTKNGAGIAIANHLPKWWQEGAVRIIHKADEAQPT
jgi:hypothetical protein